MAVGDASGLSSGRDGASLIFTRTLVDKLRLISLEGIVSREA